MKHLYPQFSKYLAGLLLLLFSYSNVKAQQFVYADNASPYAVVNNGNVTMSAPTASFTVTGTQCAGYSFTFTNGSSAGSYKWDFGDGTTSTDANPVKAYAKSGNYKVTLEVKSGSDVAYADQALQVLPTPDVSYTTLVGTLNGKSYTFISTSTIESGTMTYLWKFSDGTTSTLVNPTKTFPANGSYSVELNVTSDMGCIDTASTVVAVGAAPTCTLPVASFTTASPNIQCRKGNSYSFTNTSSLTAGSISYLWDFGDSTFSTAKNPTKIFSDTGNYTVTLIAINNTNGGCNAKATKAVTLVGPYAQFVVNPTALQCFAGNKFEFTNQSNANTSDLEYKWNLAGSTTTITNPEKSYTAPGTYNVTLIARTSASGCADTLVQSLTVYPSPKAVFNTSLAASTGTTATINFSNSSTISGSVNNYEWFFGDGNASVFTNPSNTYPLNPSSVTVKLIANTADGCRDSVSKTVVLATGVSTVIPNASPLASLPVSPDAINVYPNPAVNSAQVSVMSSGGDILVVKVRDRNGRLISETRQASSLSPTTLIRLNTQNLTSGTYFVEVTTATGTRIGSSVIIKG